MHSFTQKPLVALPRDVEDWAGEGSESQVLDFAATALPGSLEVHLNRATILEQVGGLPLQARPCFVKLCSASVWDQR